MRVRAPRLTRINMAIMVLLAFIIRPEWAKLTRVIMPIENEPSAPAVKMWIWTLVMANHWRWWDTISPIHDNSSQRKPIFKIRSIGSLMVCWGRINFQAHMPLMRATARVKSKRRLWTTRGKDKRWKMALRISESKSEIKNVPRKVRGRLMHQYWRNVCLKKG